MADENQITDDDWAAAMQEQAATEAGDSEVDRVAAVRFIAEETALLADALRPIWGMWGDDADEGQRHDLQGAENGPECHNHCGRAGEIQMMERADDAAGQEDCGRKQHRSIGGSQSNQLQSGKEERDNDSGENLEEPLHPKMHDPPPPVLDD